MAKTNVFVLKDSVTVDGDFIAKGTKVSLDAKEDKKLFDLGNVEEFDEKKHIGEADPKLKLELENKDLRDKIAALESDNKVLQEKVAEVELENQSLKDKIAKLEPALAEIPKGK